MKTLESVFDINKDEELLDLNLDALRSSANADFTIYKDNLLVDPNKYLVVFNDSTSLALKNALKLSGSDQIVFNNNKGTQSILFVLKKDIDFEGCRMRFPAGVELTFEGKVKIKNLYIISESGDNVFYLTKGAKIEKSTIKNMTVNKVNSHGEGEYTYYK